MRLALIDQAYNIEGFNNQATELTYALSKPIDTNGEQKRLVYYGYQLALDMIADRPELIRPTLLGTMRTVRYRYTQLTKYEYKNISAISLATNHVEKLVKIQQAIADSNAITMIQSKQMNKRKQYKTIEVM